MAQGSGEDITRYTDPHEESEPIGQVHKGMKVVDASGDDLGKVSDVKMGDPQAVTDTGEYPEGSGWDVGLFGTVAGGRGTTAEAADPAAVGGPGNVGGEPDLPEPLAARLLREGYIKIDAGLFGSDRYAPAWTIERVDGDTVHLSANKDDLPKAS